MKYLDIESLRALNLGLSFPTSSGDRHVLGRIETYSCKAAGADKKLFRFLENKYQEDVEEAKGLSPEQSSLTNTMSPFGPLTQAASRKVLFYLIATLNASFPDYDFRYVDSAAPLSMAVLRPIVLTSRIRPCSHLRFSCSSLSADQFTKEPNPESCTKSISTTLLNVGCPAKLKASRMWDCIDDAINIDECDVYSYTPDAESDPYEDEGPVWSFNYFFFNKNLKRILFFTCRCISNLDELENASDQELVFGDLHDEPVETEFYPTTRNALRDMAFGGGLRL
ncbi:RNA polymerase III-inhibiting protein maf1 [Coemansia nantahalensis]|uniref:RNA polymerase III-inhibiting protein maf1 n=1 Tax=Coemansia helicoidea TaxID=1286919 RepID=A0ACC1KV53_9FUNG|nr:RNA polymerase III-inhibiting protein maf1 [Coemansia nantahalensis]KAJ2795859.1 RNA polymerase III-inhibiting protein maf1 [Coemansia helicoidea]